MKTTIIFSILLGLSVASPTFIPRADDSDDHSYDDSRGMKWTGEVLPGQNHTFYGDIDSIYSQILGVNPDYKAKLDDPSLVKRNKADITCGNFATAVSEDTFTASGEIGAVGGTCHVKAKSCIRISCRNTSGVWLCNENKKAISPQCKYLSLYVDNLWSACSPETPLSLPLSGQQFDTDNYNVVVGYANCKEPSTKKPSDYPKWGPNGKPSVTCTKCGTA